MDKKRLLIASLFILTCIVLGYALYRIFFAPPSEIVRTPTPVPSVPIPNNQQFPSGGQANERNGVSTQTQLPLAGGATGETRTGSGEPIVPPVRQIFPETVMSPTLSSAGGVQFYNADDGKFYRVGPDGKPQLLNDQVFYNVQHVTWSPVGNESILEYPDGTKIYYNFETKKQATLPKHWEEFSFAPQGEKIAAKSIGFSPENRWLVISNPDGTEVTPIAAMGDNAGKVQVNWSPNKQIVATSLTGESLGEDRQQVLMVGLHHENFRALTVEGRDFRGLWSPNGKQIVYSVYSSANDYKPQLWIDNSDGDAIGSDRKLLDLNTWANKCSFADSRFLYCGVPDTLQTGAGFAPAVSDQTPDHLLKIDLQTGIKTEIPITDSTAHVIDSIVVSPDGKQLFFTDKTQSGLFQVNL